MAREQNIQQRARLRRTNPRDLTESFDRCRKAGVPKCGYPQKEMPPDQLKTLKQHSRGEYVFPHRVLSIRGQELGEFIGNPRIGYAIFNKHGDLMNLYGAEPFIDFCRKNHIYKGSNWSEETMGTTAVSLGMHHHCGFATVGEENYIEPLHNVAIYFAPFYLSVSPGSTDFFEFGYKNGGAALIMPKEAADCRYLTNIVEFSQMRSSQMFWFQFTKNYNENYDVGSMLIDVTTEDEYILAIGKNLRKLFQLKDRVATYEKLNQIISRQPENSAFWDAIKRGKDIENRSMRLVVQGTEFEVRLSAHVYHDKPLDLTLMILYFHTGQLLKELMSKYTGNTARYEFSDIVGKNKQLLSTLNQAKKAALSNGSILLTGESGVGKDILAQAIHNHSYRRHGPFVAINCSAFSRELIASELFGYAEGSFTGAKKGGNMGKFELADTGTIFLDEIGDMPFELQAILLRVLEEKKFSRIGSNHVLETDVRIIAATNINLFEKVKKGLFREDLFYRLSLIRIGLPPLRMRKDDIMLLTDHFITDICSDAGQDKVKLSPEAKQFFMTYAWPGNVRELRNLLDGLIHTGEGRVIHLDQIREYLQFEQLMEKSREAESGCPSMPKEPRHGIDREEILAALKATGNNKSRAAEYLGISRRTLYRKLEQLDIQ